MGPRQRVIVVAAQREMVERLLRAVRYAGLRAEGVDLSAFALIRSLYRPARARRHAGREGGEELSERVLYLNVGGLTNMAIAEGTVCRFTRVVGGGLEAMASEIAERRGIPLVDARALLAAFELPRPGSAPLPPPLGPVSALPPEAAPAAPAGAPALPDPETVQTWALAQDPGGTSAERAEEPEAADQLTAERSDEAIDRSRIDQQPAAPVAESDADVRPSDPEVRMVLENGIREIVGEVRNSLDFHRSQEGGGEVQSVVLSGPALEMHGFSEALEADLGIAVRREAVRFADATRISHSISPHRLAIATGLATEEAPR